MKKFKCGACYEIPTLCHIETTYLCNQKCIFCYNPRREVDVNYDKLDKIVESVVKAKIPHVYISGGEPSILDLNKLNTYIEKLAVNSSVTVLTNGLKCMKGLSKKIACLGIPLHGRNAEEHEAMTGVKGSFEKAINSIRYYVSEGYDVRCILVLTGYNYDKIFDMIKLANDLEMESVYVDRYEDGGIGATNSLTKKLKPTIDEFRVALGKILDARNYFKRFSGKIGFGTAIPYCLDSRLLDCDIQCNCGVGTSFCAINNQGDLRICNQSEVVYGNVLTEDIKTIWNKRELCSFRNIDWVIEPCKSCALLKDCLCGCKVDVNCSNTFCIDYAIRNDIDGIIKENIRKINSGKHKIREVKREMELIKLDDVITLSNYTKINKETRDILLVTKYQTVIIDKYVEKIINHLKSVAKCTPKDLEKIIKVEENEILRICTKLLEVEAIKYAKEK